MSHWMVRAAQRAGLDQASTLDLPGDVSAADAWAATQAHCAVDALTLAQVVASAFGMEVADLEAAEPTAAKLLGAAIARKHGVFPLRDEDRYLAVATADPADPAAEQEVAFASGRSARFTVAPPDLIAEAIERTYSADVAAASLLSRVGQGLDAAGDVELAAEDDEPEAVSEEETAAGPVVRLTNIILHEAVARGASDVHLQPMASHGLVRFRSDGVLHNGMQMPLQVLTRVVSRIKIMARLDITDRLRPQDGRARIVVDGQKYDLRISTVPTRRAEKCVIRVLDTQGTGTLVETGIATRDIERIRAALSHRDGIVVVTGPTGSGKTTTLYGALRDISTEDVNIMTVEDPVEYELPRLTQIQVEHKQGMTFASALRAILRQDPDVIFVGEIRDAETAEIAAQASLTGHLVLASLHTNDAVGAIRRFLDLGLDPGTLGETLRASLAQRLVRKVCAHCAVPADEPLTPAEERLSARYGVRPAVRAIGCERCVQQGYMGRLPVTEFMVSTPDLVRLVLDGAPPVELQRQAQRDGMVTLLQSALERVQAGETTLEEVERVVGAGAEATPAPDRTATPQGAVSNGSGASTGAAPVPEVPHPADPLHAASRPHPSGPPDAPQAPPAPPAAAPAAQGPAAHPSPPPPAGRPSAGPSAAADATAGANPGSTPAAPAEDPLPMPVQHVEEALAVAAPEPADPGPPPQPPAMTPEPPATTAAEPGPPAPTAVAPAAPALPAPVTPTPAAPTKPMPAEASQQEPDPGPLAPPADQPDAASRPPPPAATPGADGERVLIVDDDPTTRIMGRSLLTGEGYEVAEAPDGSEALLRLARGERFSLMILDLDMPKMGGREVLEAVRRSMATATLPVVVLTASPDREAEKDLLALGADDYLRKPIDPPTLIARVRGAIYRGAA